MIMGFDLEGHRQTVADIDDAGVFSGSLQNSRPLCWQPPQMHPRALIAAVLAPHDTEDAKFRERRFTLQDADDFLILGFSDPMLAQDVVRDLHKVISYEL